MKQDQISGRQLMTLVWAGLLAVAAEHLPSVTVAIAGRGAWMTPLLWIPILAGMGWVLVRLCGKEGNLVDGLKWSFGRVIGGGVLLIYIVWGTMLLSLRFRLCAERLSGGGDRDGALWFLLLGVAGLTGWMAWGKCAAFARTTEVFFGMLVITYIIVVGLSILKVRAENMLPIWWDDAPSIVAGMPAVGGVLGYAIFAALLMDNVAWSAKRGRDWFGWCLVGCVSFSVMSLVAIGSFGPVLTQQVDAPFFQLAKSVGVDGAFQRVESVVAAIWTVSDLALMGLLLRGCTVAVRGISARAKDTVVTGILLVVGSVGAVMLFGKGIRADDLGKGLVLWGNLALGIGVPIVALTVGWVRHRGGDTIYSVQEVEKPPE